MDNGFYDTIKPKNIDEIIGNKKVITDIKKFLEQQHSIIYIYGKTGLGKTLFINSYAKEHNLELINIDINDTEQKNINKKKLLYSSLIPTCYMIKDIDILSKSRKLKHKKFIDFIIKNYNILNNKLIFITGSGAKIKKIIKNINAFQFRKPQDKIILKDILLLLKKRDFTITPAGEKLISDIIQKSDFNFETIFKTLEVIISNNKDKKKISNTKEISIFLENYQIDREKELFTLAGDIFSKYKTDTEKMNSFYKEPSLLPLFVFDNSYQLINLKNVKSEELKKSKSKTKNYIKNLENIRDMANCFSDYSILENYSYQQCNFSLKNYSGYISCISSLKKLQEEKDYKHGMIRFPTYYGKIKKKMNNLGYNENNNILPSAIFLE